MDDKHNLKNGEKLVVTDNGVRVSGATHMTVESAAQEAAAAKAKRKLTEGGGDGGSVKVKQQIFG